MGFIESLKQYFSNTTKKRKEIKGSDRIILLPLNISPSTPIDYNTVEDLVNYIKNSGIGSEYFIYDDIEKYLRNNNFDETLQKAEYKVANGTGNSGLSIERSSDGRTKRIILFSRDEEGNIHEILISDGWINLYGEVVQIDTNRTIISTIPSYETIEDAQNDLNLSLGQLYRVGSQIHIKLE